MSRIAGGGSVSVDFRGRVPVAAGSVFSLPELNVIGVVTRVAEYPWPMRVFGGGWATHLVHFRCARFANCRCMRCSSAWRASRGALFTGRPH